MIQLPLKSITAFLISLLLFAISCKKDDACDPATTASASTDQNIVGTSAQLSANNPDSGTGSWSIVTGTGGAIVDPLNPESTFTGISGTTYELKWSISGCPSSEDIVQITFSCNDVSNAGPDQSVSSGVSTILAASAPVNGTGVWSIVSGTGGVVATPSSPVSQFTGTADTDYVLRWTLPCSNSQDDVSISFNNGDPVLISVDKTSVINGEIITVTGLNFSSNYNGGSQINALKTTAPYQDQEVFLTILSRTATEIKAVMLGTNGGANGPYRLRYLKKPDTNPFTLFSSDLIVDITSITPNQFFTSSTFTSSNVSKGAEASFGIKNGSLIAGDYTIKLLDYNYTTGVSTEYPVSIINITANGYGDTMDKITFTVPAALPSTIYYVKISYGSSTLIGGWGSLLNVS